MNAENKLIVRWRGHAVQFVTDFPKSRRDAGAPMGLAICPGESLRPMMRKVFSLVRREEATRFGTESEAWECALKHGMKWEDVAIGPMKMGDARYPTEEVGARISQKGAKDAKG